MTLVLTLRLDATSQAYFETLRKRHFPPERNQIPAHLTLFHTLPDRADVFETLSSETSAFRGFELRVTGVRSLGKGVAYTLEAPDLQRFHARLVTAFAAELTAQDRQTFRPHVVVQNKVTPEAARELLLELQGSFVAWGVRAEGVDLWRYLGGPWELAQHFPFVSAQ